METEETKAKFREKLKSLLELGKKKRNILEYQEISDFFRDMNLDEEKMEKVLDFLEANKVDVLRISDGDDEDDDIILDDEDEVEVEKIDLSVPGGRKCRGSGTHVLKGNRQSAAAVCRRRN